MTNKNYNNAQLFKYSYSKLAADLIFLKNWKLKIMTFMITPFYFLVIRDISLFSNNYKSKLKSKCLFLRKHLHF